MVGPGAAVINCGLVSCSQPPPPPPPAAGNDGGGGPKPRPTDSNGDGGVSYGPVPGAAASPKWCCYGNGVAVAVGPETAGRELACYATMTLAEAAATAVDRGRGEAVEELRAAVDRYAELAR